MLFRPIRFARILRWDEPLWPALMVAAVAYLIPFTPETRDVFNYIWNMVAWNLVHLLATLSCIAFNTVAFTLSSRRGLRGLSGGRRLRLFLLVSFYSTCFVAAWNLTNGPPALDSWNDAEFCWPLAGDFAKQWQKLVGDWHFLGRTIIFYWWFGILMVFAAMRCKPRWVSAFFVAIVPAAAYAATLVGVLLFKKLDL